MKILNTQSLQIFTLLLSAFRAQTQEFELSPDEYNDLWSAFDPDNVTEDLMAELQSQEADQQNATNNSTKSSSGFMFRSSAINQAVKKVQSSPLTIEIVSMMKNFVMDRIIMDPEIRARIKANREKAKNNDNSNASSRSNQGSHNGFFNIKYIYYGYGCYCHFGENWNHGKGSPIPGNEIDRFCHHNYQCKSCVQIDIYQNGGTLDQCDPGTVKYVPPRKKQIRQVGLENACKMNNPRADACALHACICDAQFIDDLVGFMLDENKIFEERYRHTLNDFKTENPGFNFEKQCKPKDVEKANVGSKMEIDVGVLDGDQEIDGTGGETSDSFVGLNIAGQASENAEQSLDHCWVGIF